MTPRKGGNRVLRQLLLVSKAKRLAGDRCLDGIEGKLREQRLWTRRKDQERCWKEQGLRRPTVWAQLAWRRCWKRRVQGSLSRRGVGIDLLVRVRVKDMVKGL